MHFPGDLLCWVVSQNEFAYFKTGKKKGTEVMLSVTPFCQSHLRISQVPFFRNDKSHESA